jgi:excinuclease ABC subunit C
MIIDIKQNDFIKQLPSNSGVYRFKDESGLILYVGKAINLYKRVKSYFRNNKLLSPRIQLMVKSIRSIEFTVTNSEHEALILEINLIKSLKPKYNIIFRDDKTYPYIRFTSHEYPRIEYYRGKVTSLDKHFGPYTDSNATKRMIDVIQKIFLIRTCNDIYYNNRVRPCMLYQIKRCSAPCVGYINQSDYSFSIKFAQQFLSGESKFLLEQLQNKMNEFANDLKFEESAKIRDIIFSIKNILKDQRVNINEKINIEVFHYKVIDDLLYVYLIVIKNGIYVNDNYFKIKINDNDIKQSMIILLENIYLSNNNKKQIYIDMLFNKNQNDYLKNILNLFIVKSKQKFVNRLIELADDNLTKIIDKPKFIEEWLILKELWNLDSLIRVECIDVSHHQGDSCVASVVVAENGILKNSEYRRYSLNRDFNGNDLMAIEYVVSTRYSKVSILPDILLIDGGIMQYNVIKNILSKNIKYDKIKLMAIFKGQHRNPKFDRLIINSEKILEVSDSPTMFSFLQVLRDEAHRFAITGHRLKQEKKMSQTSLLEIPGVGVVTKKLLLNHFGNVKSVANASKDDLKAIKGIGDDLSDKIYSFFH